MIISGYANFEYAQNALKQGVSDYLLKPINKDALNESLTKMVNQIETARRTDMAFQDIQNERREELIKLRNMLLHDLCHDRSLGLSEDILREKYYLNVQPGLYQVLAIKQDAGGNDSIGLVAPEVVNRVFTGQTELVQRDLALCRKIAEIEYGKVGVTLLIFSLPCNRVADIQNFAGRSGCPSAVPALPGW